jgi:hypothetical protein
VNIDGKWVGFGLGDIDPKVAEMKVFLARKFAWVRNWTPSLGDSQIYDHNMVNVVMQMQINYNMVPTGVMNAATQERCGFYKPVKVTPVFVSVEGHLSNMWAGPVADTGTQLEMEHLCRHQPTGFENGDLPFNNQSGVEALRENIVQRVPSNAKLIIGGFSQGMIVVHDYLEQYGIPSNLKAVLMYGNPNRALGSVAPWCDQATIAAARNTHGLDPVKRFELPGDVSLRAAGVPFVDVFRKGDIFAQNGDDTEGACKAAVYEAVARGKFWGSPTTLATTIASALGKPLLYVLPIVMATLSGMGFLAQNPNPHYSPFDIEPGKAWVRQFLV